MYQHIGWWFPSLDRHFSKDVGEFPIAYYQQGTIDTAYQYVKQFKCAVDVGANIGLFSVRFSKKFSNVIAFEPVISNFECLQKNINSIGNIKIHNTGLGDHKSTELISIPVGGDNCGIFSIVDFKDYEGAVISETIQLDTLDSYMLSPDLIKIDVQGYDLNVLKGGVQTINQYKPVVISEIEKGAPKAEFFEFFRNLNYELAGTVRRDHIWIPR